MDYDKFAKYAYRYLREKNGREECKNFLQKLLSSDDNWLEGLCFLYTIICNTETSLFDGVTIQTSRKKVIETKNFFIEKFLRDELSEFLLLYKKVSKSSLLDRYLLILNEGFLALDPLPTPLDFVDFYLINLNSVSNESLEDRLKKISVANLKQLSLNTYVFEELIPKNYLEDLMKSPNISKNLVGFYQSLKDEVKKTTEHDEEFYYKLLLLLFINPVILHLPRDTETLLSIQSFDFDFKNYF